MCELTELRAWQILRFERRPIVFIRIVGTHNSGWLYWSFLKSFLGCAGLLVLLSLKENLCDKHRPMQICCLCGCSDFFVARCPVHPMWLTVAFLCTDLLPILPLGFSC